MRRATRVRLENLEDRGNSVFRDLFFEKSTFSGCALSSTDMVESRSRVENVELHQCLVEGCEIGCAILDTIIVKDLRVRGELLIRGAAFRHVKLSGRIGFIWIQPNISPADRPTKRNDRLQDVNAEFYKSVDWALDIADAEFSDIELGGIPIDLVRRDPGRQVFLVRTVIEAVNRDSLRLPQQATDLIQVLMNSGREVLFIEATGRRSKAERDLAAGIAALRDAGLTR